MPQELPAPGDLPEERKMIGGLLAEIEQPPANLSTTLIVRERAAPKSGGRAVTAYRSHSRRILTAGEHLGLAAIGIFSQRIEQKPQARFGALLRLNQRVELLVGLPLRPQQLRDLLHTDLRQLFEALHPFVEARFQLVHSRFVLVHSRFVLLESRFALLESRFALLESRFALLE